MLDDIKEVALYIKKLVSWLLFCHELLVILG